MRSETVVHAYLAAINADLRAQWARMKLATNPETDTAPDDVMNGIHEELNHLGIQYNGLGTFSVHPHTFGKVTTTVMNSYDERDKDQHLYLSMLTTRVNDEVMHQDRRLKCCIVLDDNT